MRAARAIATLVVASGALAAEPTARDCGRCHTRHYDEWSGSAHARATASALYRWQELLWRASLGRDGKPDDGFCAGCHAPAEGAVACLTCHRMAAVAEGADPRPGKRITWGDANVMLGPLADPRDAIVHGAKKSDIHGDERVCMACHDHDAAPGAPCCTVVREWREAEAREYMKCQSCHMRGVKNQPVARDGPPRTLHRHNFPAAGDVDQARGGWELAFGKVGGGQVEVVVTNRSGHALPGGEPYGTRVVLRVEARDADGRVAGAAERSFGFEMLDAAGRPTIFVHEAVRRGTATALASGERRAVRLWLSPAASYMATLGYAAFDPPEAAWARVEELRAWMKDKRPEWALELSRLDGKVAALARPVAMRVVRWPE